MDFFKSLHNNVPKENIVRCPYSKDRMSMRKSEVEMVKDLIAQGVSGEKAARAVIDTEHNYKVKVFLVKFLAHLKNGVEGIVKDTIFLKKGTKVFNNKLGLCRLIHGAHIWQASCMEGNTCEDFDAYNREVLIPTLTPETIESQKENNDILMMSGYEPLIAMAVDIWLFVADQDEFKDASLEKKREIFMSALPSLERFAMQFPNKIPYKKLSMESYPAHYGLYAKLADDFLLLEKSKVVFNPDYTEVDEALLEKTGKVVHKGCLAGYIIDPETKESFLSSQSKFIMNLVFDFCLREES